MQDDELKLNNIVGVSWFVAMWHGMRHKLMYANRWDAWKHFKRKLNTIFFIKCKRICDDMKSAL